MAKADTSRERQILQLDWSLGMNGGPSRKVWEESVRFGASEAKLKDVEFILNALRSTVNICFIHSSIHLFTHSFIPLARE